MTTVLTVRLDDDLSDALTVRAANRNMTKAKLVRRLITSEIAIDATFEDESMIAVSVEDLQIIKDALQQLLLKDNSPNGFALYCYVCDELSELKHSLAIN